jgi:diaminopimelate decarboxylase
MTCDGRDIISSKAYLTNEIEVGDWMIFGGMGAYTVGPKSNFNGMKSTAKVI